MAVVVEAYWYSRIRQPLVDGVTAQVAAETAEVGAITYVGRASVLPSTMVFCEITVVVDCSVGRKVVANCQVVAVESTLLKSEVVPSESFRVKELVRLPVRVRSSAPDSGFQPPLLVAVKPVSSPSTSTTATDVADVLRT